MVTKKSSKWKGAIVQAALEEEGLDNPIEVVTIIKALSAIMAAVEAFQHIQQILKHKG